MWKGIQLGYYSSIYIAGSEVNDAVIAVNVNSLAGTIHFNDCEFKRNFTSFRVVPPNNQNLNLTYNLNLDGVRVNGTGPLKAMYDGQSSNEYGPRAKYGFYLERINGGEIGQVGEAHTIKIASNTGKNACITTESGRNHTITNNDLQMETGLTSGIKNTALSYNMTEKTKFHCNRLSNTANGISVSNACANTTFKANSFSGHGVRGLFYDGTASVGPQIYRGNTWDYPNSAANPGAVENGIDVDLPVILLPK